MLVLVSSKDEHQWYPTVNNCSYCAFTTTCNGETRGKSGGRRNLVVTLNVQWTSFTAKSEFQMTTSEHGFHLKSGFRKIVWPPNMVSVLFVDSQKYCVHWTFLYHQKFIMYTQTRIFSGLSHDFLRTPRVWHWLLWPCWVLNYVLSLIFEFCHNLSFWVLSHLEFLSLVTILIFEFFQSLSFHSARPLSRLKT